MEILFGEKYAVTMQGRTTIDGTRVRQAWSPILALVLSAVLAAGSPAALAGAGCGTDQWSALPPAPLTARDGHVAVWTGTEMIVWGGEDASAALLGDGARFDPDLGTWTTITTTGAPAPRRDAVAVWTGTEMIVWGGEGGSGPLGDGARYNPGTDTWSPLSLAGAPSPRRGHRAVWTGTEMIVWGGEDGLTFLADGASYDPSTDTWAPLGSVGAPSGRADHSAVWTGTEMIVWGGRDASGRLGDGAAWNATADTWSALPSSGSPSARSDHGAVWTGTEMIVWGGQDDAGPLGSGGRYDPAGTWAPVSAVGEPSQRHHHAQVWSGWEMIVWGGREGLGPTASGARYEPASDTWSPVETLGAPSARSAMSAVWSGRQMLLWGGRGAAGVLADGSAYCGCAASPAADDATCDAIDDDCDGSVDEDYPQSSTSCGVGACSATGTLSCVDGTEEDSCAPGAPATDDATCDGVDDDCDGSVDEDYTPVSTTCGAGLCAASGTTSCSGGVEQDSCSPLAPALELCDGLDNDCDGSVDEDQGVRYVAPGGDDAGNTCLDPAQPCASINHAVQVACDGETVSVAEGEYFEDVLIDHPVTVDGEGVPTRTILRGSGTVDVVRIFSSDVHWTAVNVYDTVGVACMRIGDSNHTGLRNVKIDNTSLAGCSIGAIWDSTGDPPDRQAPGTPSSPPPPGTTSRRHSRLGHRHLMVGGNGKIQLKLGHLTNNDGPGW
ncbi:MAG: MopE-related protein [Acidobacteriota bacterium]|nr:MopE-related protein [Acidobacteriota bacterium]